MPRLQPVLSWTPTAAPRERLAPGCRAPAGRPEAINELWVKLLDLRCKIAANAGKPDYRAYRWQQLLRFDYTPEDCRRFHQAIEQVVVPAARRIYEKRRRRLGVESLRPWDWKWTRSAEPPLKPYAHHR